MSLTNLAKDKKRDKELDKERQKFIGQADKGSAGERGKRLNVEIPEDLHHDIKLKAAERGLTVRQLVIEALRKVAK